MALELHRWTRNGEEWACGAYDHGPFCRLCSKVDGTLAAILENVDLGYAEFVGTNSEGELRFKVTPEGEAHIDQALGGEWSDLKAQFKAALNDGDE